MSRNRFFDKKVEFFTAKQAAEITGASLLNASDQNLEIHDIATLTGATKNDISFLNSGQYFDKFQASNAGFCFAEEKYAAKAPQGMVVLTHKNPYFAYAKLAENFYREKEVEFVETKLIHPSAEIGTGSKIAPNAYIGKNVKIGKNCYIGPNSSIMDNCIIGDNSIINSNVVISYATIGSNCIIHNGANIGQDGFGFAHNQGINHKIIQLGIVEIADNVEVGANTCIDRGAIENTSIGEGTKIDNLVQIGHNVKIGKGTVMAGGTGVAGSAKIGNFVQIGGNCSIAGHISIGDGAKISGMSGLMRDVEPMQVVAGAPAIPIRDWHRMNSKLIKISKRDDAAE